MVSKQVKVSKATDELLELCVDEYLRHHKEMREIKISRNKIIFEIATLYLKV